MSQLPGFRPAGRARVFPFRFDRGARYRRALPVLSPGQPLARPVRLAPGRYVCGDHRDTPSIQGALVSGRRAASAVPADLRPALAAS